MMNVIEYDKNVDGLNGTSLQGHVLTTYDTLCEVLGQPTYTDANPYEKVACEWTIKAKVRDEFMDEDDWDTKVASIYCWKEGRIPTEEYLWHVGGIETNTEVAIPLDSLGIALLGLGVMVWGVLSIVEIEEDSYE